MKKVLFVGLLMSITLVSCKQCLECKYATLKGTEVEKFCSSTKQDREDFENHMDSVATANGSQSFCTKERY